MRFHRDAAEIPTSVEERKNLLWWIVEHPVWKTMLTIRGGEKIECDRYERCVHIEPAYVDPLTDTINKDEARNTAFRVWIEAGPVSDLSEDPISDMPEPDGGWNEDNKWCGTHDLRLDCGAPDLETALLELAVRVKMFYNDDGTDRGDAPEKCQWMKRGDEYESACTSDDGGYCTKCGFKVD